jgi:hypothetical protein
MPEKKTNTQDGVKYSGTIREYIPPMGGDKALVIIDGGLTGMTVISANQSQIIPVAKNFPRGSDVVFYWSDNDDQYIFRKPEATSLIP